MKKEDDMEIDDFYGDVVKLADQAKKEDSKGKDHGN